MSKSKTIPYVYIVLNKSTGLKYIGVRYRKGCTPDDFWKYYFTSSKVVKKLIDIYGKDDFIVRILQTFENEYEARKYEETLIKKVLEREDYMNVHSGFVSGKTEEVYLKDKQAQKRIRSLYGKLQVLHKIGFHKFSKKEKQEASSLGGKAAAKKNRELKRAIFDPEVRKRQHATLKALQLSSYYNPVLRRKACSKGGKNGAFSKAYYEKNGLSEEDRIEAQRQRGRKGGKKNKGFKWYFDGKTPKKYTAEMQKNLSFSEFLLQNPTFCPGRSSMEDQKGFHFHDGKIQRYYSYFEHKKRPFEEFLKANPKYKKGKLITYLNENKKNI